MLRKTPFGVKCLLVFDGSLGMRERAGMKKRCLREVCGSWGLQGVFKLRLAVAISPTSPYKHRNWLYSSDQDGDGEWQGGGRSGDRTGPQAGGEERAGGGRVDSNRTLEFHSKKLNRQFPFSRPLCRIGNE